VKKILVVDDEPDAVKMLKLTLTLEGYEVVTAANGQAAIQQAAQERPDLVILDVMMPEMDGYELSRQLRRMVDFAQVPIVFLSARTEVVDKVEGLRAGANDYITKPVSPQELAARVGALLGTYAEPEGYLAALFGSKAGVGTTTLAVNLALALRQQSQAQVVLVDGHSEGGDVGVFLHILPSHHAGELIAVLDQLDPEVFKSALAEHPSGLRVLLAPPDTSVSPPISPSNWEQILIALRRSADFVIFDGPPLRSATWTPILDLADDVFLITTPEITAMKRLSSAHSLAQSRRRGLANVYILLNRYTEQSGFSLGAITRALGTPIHVHIDDVGPLNTYAINHGEPLVLSDKRGAVTRAVSSLAREILQGQASVASQKNSKQPVGQRQRRR